MSDYSTQVVTILKQAQSLEESLPIRNEACRAKFFFHPHPTAKVCLFFHGFTAGPYQFEPLGKALFEEGYNVLVPLLPGHGVAGSWNGDNPPPLPTDRAVYQEFALSWLEEAKTLGKQVIVGGLSNGGTLAAWLALEKPREIKQSLLFAPYLSSQSGIVDFLVEVLPIYFEWLNKDNPGNFGYDGFRMPALRLFVDIGQEILDRVKYHPPEIPMFIISSESDQVVDQDELWTLFNSTLEHQPKSWYFNFDKIFDIPHTMMTQLEGNKYQDLLMTVAKAYLDSEITWVELIKIGKGILQGKTFDSVVDELNLQNLVSPNVSVLLTVMDKEVIIRNS